MKKGQGYDFSKHVPSLRDLLGEFGVKIWLRHDFRHRKLAQDCTKRLAHVSKRQYYDFIKHAPSSEGFLVHAHDKKRQNHDFSKHAPKLGGHQDGFDSPEMTKY